MTGSIYSGNSGVYRLYLIVISSYDILKIHTQSLQRFGLTRCSRDFVDPNSQLVSYHLLTLFQHSLSENRSVSRIPFRCRARCSGVLMVGSLPPSSVVSTQWPLRGAFLCSLNGCLPLLFWLSSTTILSQMDCMYTCSKTHWMHVMLWCSNSCDCYNDKYNRQKTLCLSNSRNHCCVSRAPSLPQSFWCSLGSGLICSQSPLQTCAELSAAPKYVSPICQI